MNDSLLIITIATPVIVSVIIIAAIMIINKRIKSELEVKKSQLNDIVVFEDNQAYFIHEILDFEETILQKDDDLHMKNVNNQKLKNS